MKKITLQLLLTILPAFVGFAQGTQDFETQTALTTQYADGSFTENGITYTYVHCRNEGLGTNDDYSIGGTKGIMLRRPNEPSSLEWTIPNGIGTLSFDARKAFTGASSRQLEVLVNGTSVWMSPTFGEGVGVDATVHSFTVPIDEQGSTTVKIQLIGTNGNKQTTIDNISWTAAPPTYCVPSYFQQGAYTTSFVTTEGITNANYTSTSQQGTQGYLDLSSDTSYHITQTAGLSFNLTHTFTSGMLPNHTLRIWVDWNNDETFDDSELIFNEYSVTGTLMGTIFVPDDKSPGNYRMRMRSSSQNVAPNACQLWDNGQALDFTLIVQPQGACSGTPTIGAASVTPETANVGITYIVDVDNYSAETGLTFVWESSTDNWASITTEYTGNAYQSLTKTALAPVGHQIKYRLKVTCTNSGLTTTSDEVTFTTVKEYCTPSYTSTDYYTSVFSTSVNGNTQTNFTATSQTGTQGYNDLSGDVAYNTIQAAGESFDFSHTFAGNFFPGDNSLIIWIDWNDDGTFEDADERVFNNYTGMMSTQVTQAGTVDIPTNIVAGNYRMRVRCQWGNISTTPCDAKVYGQALDFTLVVNTSSCVVNIPDPNFKAYLVGNTAINTNGDGEIQCDEAQTFAGIINVANLNVSDLTGIEAFVNITQLSCQNNQLTNLDVSNNTALTYLSCQNNQLTSLDISNNIALTQFQCQSNQLTNLDLNNNAALTNLSCATNNLTSLDLSNNTALTNLICSTNNLTSLDVSNNTALTQLRCTNNQLTSLDLSNNTALTEVTCNSNQLTSLDVSTNPALSWFRCQDNLLTSLNLKNGNNTNINTNFFNLANNPNLTCIEVDDVAYSNANWSSYKDATASFSEDCSACIVTISDVAFKNALLTHTPVIDTNNDGEIQCDEAEALTGLLNVSAKGIADLTGIEAFVNITGLNCSLNQLTSLNVGNNTALTVLNCNGISVPFFNQIAALDVSNNTALTELQCEGNLLSNLDVSNNTALTKLVCGGNPLTTLNVNNNTALTELNCQLNQLTSLDISNNTALAILNCNENQLTSLDVSNNIVLTELRCVGNQLTTLNVSNNTALLQLWCGENQLTSLDVSNNTMLTWLICPDNQLTILDTSNNIVLEYLICNENQITSLDVSNNTALKGVECVDNQLSSLNVKNGNNSNFLFFGATDNPNLICIEVDNVAYSNVTWANFKDATACFSDVACITPTFDLPTSVCQGTTVPVLPALSDNTVSGSWSPATIDTSDINTQTYTFTPTLCANPYQIEISVVATPDAPTGEASQMFIAGQTLADLIVNGTNLVWSSSSTFSDTLSDSEPLVNGTTYYVRNEDGNCQSDFLAITVTLTVNVSDFDLFGFSYYPNPVNDMLHFSSNQPVENVVVSNMLGQEINVSANSDNTSLDLSNLSTGNYFVKVTIEGVAKTIKVIKR